MVALTAPAAAPRRLPRGGRAGGAAGGRRRGGAADSGRPQREPCRRPRRRRTCSSATRSTSSRPRPDVHGRGRRRVRDAIALFPLAGSRRSAPPRPRSTGRSACTTTTNSARASTSTTCWPCRAPTCLVARPGGPVGVLGQRGGSVAADPGDWRPGPRRSPAPAGSWTPRRRSRAWPACARIRSLPGRRWRSSWRVRGGSRSRSTRRTAPACARWPTWSSPGTARVTRDGRDDAGVRVAPGVYFVRFAADGVVETGKALLLP